MGLAIVEPRIVERHGGGIGVDGNARGGSTLWFALPPEPPEVDP